MSPIIVIRLFLLATVCITHVFAKTELTSAKLATSVNQFSCELLKELNYRNENVIFSPLSVSMALGMVLKGARGATAEEIYNLLRLRDYSNKEMVHTYLSDIIRDQKLIHNAKGSLRNITIELANLVLSSKNYTVKNTFTDAMRDEYFAAVGNEDFAGNGPKIMEKVNKFVKERTHELIPKVLDKPLAPDTRLFLLNSIYFKAFWKLVFRRNGTHKERFYNSDNTESIVDFMSDRFNDHRIRVDNNKNITLVEMDYMGNASMILVLPHERYGLQRVINSISCDEIEDKLRSAQLRKVTLKLPKFKFEFEANLTKVLPKMGLSSIFSKPDLTGIADEIKVSEALHKAIISVDEGGTEAAGITAIFLPLSALQGPTFVVDHPFLFFIRDKKSGFNLFAGVLNKL